MYYPQNQRCPEHLTVVIEIFNAYNDKISSTSDDTKSLQSNDVLRTVSSGLSSLGYQVETDKKNKIKRPVLFGLNGSISVQYEVDAYHEDTDTIIEIEAGRATDNNQWLKDLLEAFLIYEAKYLVIAVKNVYSKTGKKKKDFENICDFMSAIYSSDRMKIPLNGILIIGY